jgi:hypothetical protein
VGHYVHNLVRILITFPIAVQYSVTKRDLPTNPRMHKPEKSLDKMETSHEYIYLQKDRISQYSQLKSTWKELRDNQK